MSKPDHSNRISRQIDLICDEFELAWRAGKPLSIEQTLDRSPKDLHPQLFPELLLTEWELRSDAAEKVIREEYVKRFPGQEKQIQTCFSAWLSETQNSESAQHARPPGATDADAHHIGKYEIVREIARSGMGVVYEARHPELDRRVALKVVNESHLHERQARDRFFREIRASAQMTHPNIVTAFDAGEDAGRAFLVMELLEGQDLNQLVRERGKLGEADCIEYVIQAAKGLGQIHEQDVNGKLLAHRDVKPANLFLVPANDGALVKVLDLGLAGIRQGEYEGGDNAGDRSIETQLTKGVLGSPVYISPEQAAGRPSDHRADIYSLGCTLYFLLTGHPPFSCDSVDDYLTSHISKELPHLPKSGSSDRLSRVLSRMTEKSPDDRFQSMEQVVQALAEINRPESPYRRIAFATAMVLVLLLALGLTANKLFQPTVSDEDTQSSAIQRSASSDSTSPSPSISGAATPAEPPMWTATTNHWQDCLLLPDGRGWAVGMGGAIQYTDSNGQFWERVDSPTHKDLIALSVIKTEDHVRGWAVGHKVVLSMQDNVWNVEHLKDQTGSKLQQELRSVCFIDEHQGWAAGRTNGQIWMTEDGGETWNTAQLPTRHQIHDVFFIDRKVGWVVGDRGTICATSNGGKSWSQQVSGVPQHLNACFFQDAKRGWAVAGDSVILSTTNGKDWERTKHKHVANFTDIYFSDPEHGWITGTATIETTNGGKRWSISGELNPHEGSGTPGRANLCARGVTAGPSRQPVIVGDYNLVARKTKREWSARNQTYPAEAAGFVGDIEFIDESVAFMVANNRLVSTQDQGGSWQLCKALESVQVHSVDFCDSSCGWIGGRNTIARTLDRGKTFQRVSVPIADVGFHFVEARSKQECWAIANRQSLWGTKDGGKSWQTPPLKLNVDKPIPFRGLELTANCVYAVGGLSHMTSESVI